MAQSGSKIVFDAVATGQTGAMQTGARASAVTFTFCGTGFSGDLYVDAAATSSALAQVWTTTLAANSDCTTTYAHSPASKWYRVRWTRSAGTLNVWMLISRGDVVPGALTGPAGGLTTGRVALSNGATGVTDDAGLTYDPLTDTLSVGNLTSGQVACVGASGAIIDCDDVRYNPTTKSLDVTDGRVQAANLKAIGLGTPGSITVTPTLTQVGTITTVAGSALVDGDYFTIKYDGGTVPIEFDLSPGDGTTGGRVPYVFAPGDTADQIRDGLITLLNAAAPTKLTASSGGAATVAIVLDTPGAAGDTNTENVADAGFGVTGFANPTAATTYTYKLVARLSDGSTTEAGAASTTAAGHATLSAANHNALSWSAVTGAASYDVYRTVGGATQGKIASATTALSLNDTGLAGGGETAPTVNGTGRITSGALTAGRVAIVGTDGRVEDDAGLTYDAATDTLTVAGTGRIGRGYSNANATGFLINTTPDDGWGTVSLDYAGEKRFSLASTYQVSWTATANAGNSPDTGLRRVSPGLVGVTDGSTGDGALSAKGVKLVTGTRPTCDASTRGTIFYVAGGAGVADTCDVCRKDNADAYAWVSLF